MPTARIESLNTERFAHILSVALDEFARCRYTDASFNRIIKNCQMAKGTMYYYFKSKEDLFLTIHKATLRDFRKVVALAEESVTDPSSFWSLAEDLLLEFYRTLYRKPAVSQFVTNFLTQESRREGHPAIETVGAIDAWLRGFLLRGQEIGAIRSDLVIEQVTVLTWGLWESCRSWFPAEHNHMQAAVMPDTILDLFRRTLTPIDQPTVTDDDAAFLGAPAEDLAWEQDR